MVCEDDCDDNDVTVYPGAVEICDGLDNDCNGSVDDGLTFLDYFEDADADGYGDQAAVAISSCQVLTGYSLSNTDCDDADAAVNPGAVEIEDGLDNDCDGDVDEGFEPTTVEVCHEIGTSYNLVWMLLDTGLNNYSVPVYSEGSASGICYEVELDLFDGALKMNFGYTSGNEVVYAADNDWCTSIYRPTTTVGGYELIEGTDFQLVFWDEWQIGDPCGYGWDMEVSLSYVP